MIGIGAVYVLAGLTFAGFAAFSAMDQNNPKRFGNAAFWGLLAVSFLAGHLLGDLGNGILVLALAAVAGAGLLGKGRPATTSPEERKGLAERFGDRLFVPALMLPVLIAIGILAIKPLEVNGTPNLYFHYHKSDGCFPVAVHLLRRLLLRVPPATAGA